MTASLQQRPALDLGVLDDPAVLDVKNDWTVDDLANLPEDLRYELIDGRLILPSPTGFHQYICGELMFALRVDCPPDYMPLIDLSLEVDRRNEPRPDVVVLHEAFSMRTPAPVKGALLLVEVVSPTSHFRDMHIKSKLFAAAGVRNYWIVEPAIPGGVLLTEYRIGTDGTYDEITSTNEVFTTEVPYPVTVDLPALTARRDKVQRAQQEG